MLAFVGTLGGNRVLSLCSGLSFRSSSKRFSNATKLIFANSRVLINNTFLCSGRRLSSTGRRDLDRIASQVPKKAL